MVMFDVFVVYILVVFLDFGGFVVIESELFSVVFFFEWGFLNMGINVCVCLVGIIEML